MLLRHPSRRIALTGVLATGAAAGVLATAVTAVPDRRAAWAVLVVLAGLTEPWAVWQAVRQRRRDPPCARTYTIVAVSAAAVLAAGAWWWLHR
jgi:hypothetical protein